MLRDELEQAKRSVRTESIQISIGEISSMYKTGELDILPDFQRLFRWSIEKKTGFIESILIGIPVPPAFAYEKEDGTWELIDGLQRISTVLEFMGLLKDPENPEIELPGSVLASAKYLPSLQGVTWSAENRQAIHSLDKSLQLFMRRARIDFQILKHPSDPKTKFDLFQRLNRGGAYANEQEVRSCAMVLANARATNSIRAIATSDNFRDLFHVSDNGKKTQKDIEYAVRVLVHQHRDFSSGDVQFFLDWGIIEVLTDPDIEDPAGDLEWVISELVKVGGDPLVPHDEPAAGIARDKKFSLRALEAIVVGLARNRRRIEPLEDTANFISRRIYAFWQNTRVAEMGSSGLPGSSRIQRTVPFGEEWFSPNGND